MTHVPAGVSEKGPEEVRKGEGADRGFLVFENTGEVIQEESPLKQKGWDIRVMGPPAEIRQRCDPGIESPLIEELRITKVLQEAGIPALRCAAGSYARPAPGTQVAEIIDHIPEGLKACMPPDQRWE